MRALIQRVLKAKVIVHNNIVSEISEGLVIFLGVGENDSQENCEILAEKIANLRIFSNEQGKFDKSLLDIKGQALVVSQFTLYADTKKGRRPDFTKAAKPQIAEKLYNYFVQCLKNKTIVTKTGIFAAEMKVELINNGPVTIWLDTKDGTNFTSSKSVG